MTDEERARAWLEKHCVRESFLIFGSTWIEPLAALLAEVRADERTRMVAGFVMGDEWLIYNGKLLYRGTGER